jgi:hypothetical protein
MKVSFNRFNSSKLASDVIRGFNVGNMETLIQRLAKISSRLLKMTSKARRNLRDRVRAKVIEDSERTRAREHEHELGRAQRSI